MREPSVIFRRHLTRWTNYGATYSLDKRRCDHKRGGLNTHSASGQGRWHKHKGCAIKLHPPTCVPHTNWSPTGRRALQVLQEHMDNLQNALLERKDPSSMEPSETSMAAVVHPPAGYGTLARAHRHQITRPDAVFSH